MGPHRHPLRFHSTFPEKTTRIRNNLLQWYAVNARPLPWRTLQPSPYAILVSEIMCQQTQVKTVIPYFERWMTEFPTFEALAAADIDQVMRLWSGMGYYSRGRKLLEAAKWVATNGVPTDVAGWKAVPGCGDYTAGAISRRERVSGVFATVPDINGSHQKGRKIINMASTITVWANVRGLANELVDPDKPGHFNQAVMEIGATVCTPQNPKCETCPLSGDCQAFAEGELVSRDKCAEYDIEDSDEICTICPSFKLEKMDRGKWITTHYPLKTVKKAPQEQNYITAVVSRRTETEPEYFLVQRPETGLLAGLWDFPNIDVDSPEIDEPSSVKALMAYLESLGLSSLGPLRRKGKSLHIFTHIRRTSQVYTVEVLDSTLATSLGQWVTEEAIKDMAVSELGRKVLRLALGTEKKRKFVAPEKKPKVKSQKITSFFVKGQ